MKTKSIARLALRIGEVLTHECPCKARTGPTGTSNGPGNGKVPVGPEKASTGLISEGLWPFPVRLDSAGSPVYTDGRQKARFSEQPLTNMEALL